MPCLISAARGIDCRDAIGGLKAIYFCSDYCSNILASATVTASSYIITDADFQDWDIFGTPTSSKVQVYKYDLVTDLSNLTVAIEADKATGSVMYNQTLNVVLHKVVAADLFQLGLIAKNRAQIFVQDSNDNVFLMGIEDGCYLTGGDTIATGTNRSDMNGLTLNFTAKEQDPLYILPAPTVGDAQFPFDGLADDTDLAITSA
jgi:hypothetical protein|tara:strand:- start:4300 stop:4908 length:609 start_codon:yes stop_codon:yes gene_type:complete